MKMTSSPNELNPDDVCNELRVFLERFTRYGEAIRSNRDALSTLRPPLQKNVPRVAHLLTAVLGRQGLSLGGLSPAKYGSIQDVLRAALLGGNNAMLMHFASVESAVLAWLNEAIGAIESSTWSGPKESQPILKIENEQLRTRTLDLLSAGHSYDRVIREATTVFEAAIRNAAGHDELSRRIPVSGDQTGERLVNELMKYEDPAILVSEDRQKHVAFQSMCRGVFQFLRNDYHHDVDDTTEMSWAWSVVGLIDQLVVTIDSASVNR